MAYKNLDNATYLQIQIANLYIRRHGITPKEFIMLDSEFDVLGFLRDGYEPFHLTGAEGVLREIEDYIGWSDETRYELLEGIPCMMPSPSQAH